MTDADGLITYWNQACVDFAGREPQLGQDRWCVTWRLFTLDGDPLPHDDCPMAGRSSEKKIDPERNRHRHAARRHRVAFRPYPTPLFDKAGTLKGAINMLIDISDEQAEALKRAGSALQAPRQFDRRHVRPRHPSVNGQWLRPIGQFARATTSSRAISSVSLTSSPAAISARRRTSAFTGRMYPPLFCGNTDVRQLTSPIRASTRTEPKPPRRSRLCARNSR